MNIKKRSVNGDTNGDLFKNSPVEKENQTPKNWRRFMNERAIGRAYVPTTHGISLSLCKISFCFK